jgi:hypothetical protein
MNGDSELLMIPRDDMYGSRQDRSMLERETQKVESIAWTRRAMLILTTAAVLAALGVAIASWVEIRRARDDIMNVEVPECLCPGNPGIGVTIGSAENMTALVATNTLQQLDLILPSPNAVAGRSAWVSKADELWVPDVANNQIYIYQTLT